MDNSNPTVYKVARGPSYQKENFVYANDLDREEMTAQEVFG